MARKTVKNSGRATNAALTVNPTKDPEPKSVEPVGHR